MHKEIRMKHGRNRSVREPATAALAAIFVLLAIALATAGIFDLAPQSANAEAVLTASAETARYADYERLKSVIADDSAQAVQLVSGTIVFPSTIEINREIQIEAIGEPAVFIFDFDDDYAHTVPANDTYRDNERHFFIRSNNTNERQPAVFKNIIFRSNKGTGGIVVSNGNTALHLENCVFEGLGATDAYYGGALFLRGHGLMNDKGYSVEAKNCAFIENVAMRGGVISAGQHPDNEKAGINPTIKFKNSVFIDNTGNIYLDEKTGKVIYDYTLYCCDYIKNPVFSGCVKYDTGDEGFTAAGITAYIKNGSITLCKEGYTFSGWRDLDGEDLSVNAGVTLAEDVSAKWIPKTYEIIYKGLDESSLDGLPKIHTYGRATITSVVPERKGYIFVGWLLEDSDTPTKYLTIGGKEYLSDISLTAVWERAPFPSWAIAVIIIGAVIVLATGGYVLIHRMRIVAAVQSVQASQTQAEMKDTEEKEKTAVPLYYPELDNLTHREREVFDLLIEGNTLRQISGTLNIKYDAVHFHYKNVYKKLGITSRVDLIKKYPSATQENTQ